MPRNKLIETIGPDKYLDLTAEAHNNVDSKKFRQYMKEGKSDHEIARLMGLSQPAVSNYRHVIEKSKMKEK